MSRPDRFSGAAIAAFVALLGGILATGALDAQTAYRTPPADVRDVVEAPPLPPASLGPERRAMLLMERASMPSIADLARPTLRLAGMRIDPGSNSQSTTGGTIGLRVKDIESGEERAVELPEDALIRYVDWSPDGRSVAFTNTLDDAVELWILELGNDPLANPRARRLADVPLNAAFGSPCDWTPDASALLCRLIPEDRGDPPPAPSVPVGPTVQESAGEESPVRTYQDMLQNSHDEALFEYYFMSRLARIDAESGEVSAIGEPAIYLGADHAPGGEYLLVSWIRPPYSYLVPAYRFARVTELWTAEGQPIRRLADSPVQDDIPIRGVATGPRSFDWRADAPATLVWVEALDGGDPERDVEHRDRVLSLSAPFEDEPVELARTGERYSGIRWGEGGFALLSDYNRSNRWLRTWIIDADRPSAEHRLLWDRSTERVYEDPGSPVTAPAGGGESLILEHDGWIYLSGSGQTPTGQRPFLDRLNLETLESERLWRSDSTHFERVVALLDDDASRILTRRESKTEPPNYLLRDLASGETRALTDFADPAPQLTGITSRLVTYEREDGVPLSGTLYLPPEHRAGEPLPTLLWAYPREYVDADAAGQIRARPNRFTTIRGTSHLFFLMRGYAVFDGPSMPIIGGDSANDTYVDQLVASARAAVDKLTDMGITDPDRVAIGGHSYGAFMTANLLAHSDVFRAGIARSGAYNRTLTPFGFQNEARTYWEAPEVYYAMSPFMHAADIDEPILLIHGEADNNSGTFPIQSERLYHAIQGLGGKARLVMLPHESHGYSARESVLHVLAEMFDWLDTHVKNAPPATDETVTATDP